MPVNLLSSCHRASTPLLFHTLECWHKRCVRFLASVWQSAWLPMRLLYRRQWWQVFTPATSRVSPVRWLHSQAMTWRRLPHRVCSRVLLPSTPPLSLQKTTCKDPTPMPRQTLPSMVRWMSPPCHKSMRPTPTSRSSSLMVLRLHCRPFPTSTWTAWRVSPSWRMQLLRPFMVPRLPTVW